MIDGKGQKWWGIPGVGYLERGENRPRLVHLNGPSRNVKIERIFFKDPPTGQRRFTSATGLRSRTAR